MDRYELRRQDYSLSEDQDQVRAAFAGFFERYSPSATVRAAEPLGYDAALWRRLVELGVTTMALPEAAGGDGASLVDLTLVTQEQGRRLAPVPLAEQLAARRLLARFADTAPDGLLAAVAAGDTLLSLALQPAGATGETARQLVPGGAVVTGVLGLEAAGETLVLVQSPTPPPVVQNQGSAPLAWWDVTAAGPDGSRTVLAQGPEAVAAYRTAVAEWKLLTAAALVGMTQQSLVLAVDFATTRMTLGVAIGTLQGISFPLSDVAIGTSGAENLIRRAAWGLENDPEYQAELPAAAFAYAARVATTGTTATAHAQGGLGFTIEADASLYFLRAKTWSLLGGDPRRDATAVGDELIKRARARLAAPTAASVPA